MSPRPTAENPAGRPRAGSKLDVLDELADIIQLTKVATMATDSLSDEYERDAISAQTVMIESRLKTLAELIEHLRDGEVES
jgi:hypothetical protein